MAQRTFQTIVHSARFPFYTAHPVEWSLKTKSPARWPGLLDADVRHPHRSPSSCRMQGSSNLPGEAIAARQAYFKALLKHWPESLVALRTDVLPIYEPRWLGEVEERRAHFESWVDLQNDPARVDLLTAIRNWALRFRITEDWIFQVALDTLQAYSNTPTAPLQATRFEGREPEWFWWHAPREPYLRFQPRFNSDRFDDIWHPSADWRTFKKRMTSRFAVQLTDYRRKVEKRFGTKRSDTLARDAEWTVRYQKGESAIEISESAQLIAYDDPVQFVFRSISDFAKLIGLRLRRRGERLPRT